MTIRIGINGFGRIGRNIFRAAATDPLFKDIEIAVSSHRNPADIPWGDLGVEYVAECTGLFRDDASAQPHINGGEKKSLFQRLQREM